MIKIEDAEVMGWEAAIRGMRNPMNSWENSDSFHCDDYSCKLEDCPHYIEGHVTDCFRDGEFIIGPNDLLLMRKLAAAGPVHAKYRRMITVYVDITAPLYWWKEFDTYKVGTVINSCSTMHKIADKRFEREDFSIEHLENCAYPKEGLNLDGETHWMVTMDNIISSMNVARELYLSTNDKKYWWQMIQLLPSSYNQKRTVMLNYEVLSHIYHDRKNHKLDEWCRHETITRLYADNKVIEEFKNYFGFCDWIETLPYSELITGED